MCDATAPPRLSVPPPPEIDASCRFGESLIRLSSAGAPNNLRNCRVDGCGAKQGTSDHKHALSLSVFRRSVHPFPQIVLTSQGAAVRCAPNCPASHTTCPSFGMFWPPSPLE